MPLMTAPTPLDTTTMRPLWRHSCRAAATLALTILLGMSATPVVTASPQQAPNSRVVLDLPPGYVPSPLFSGFQNDASGVSFIILEGAGRRVRQNGRQLLGRGTCQTRHH